MKYTILHILIFMVVNSFNTCGQSKVEPFPELNFTINDEKSIEVQKGMALVLDFMVSNPNALEAARIKYQYPEMIEKDSSKAKLIEDLLQSISIGKIDAPWYRNIDIQIKLSKDSIYTKFHVEELDYDEPAIVDLNSESIASFSFGKDPESIDYEELNEKLLFKAVLSYKNSKGEQTSVESNEVELEFIDPVLKEVKDYSVEQAYFMAFYWMKRKMCDKAEIFSKRLLEFEGNNPSFLMLFGDILECREDYDGAIDFYNKALEAHDQMGEYEPPVVLMRRLEELQDRFMTEEVTEEE